MTQGELEKLPIQIQKIFSDLELRIMMDLVERIKINGSLSATANWQISRLQQLGESEENIKSFVREALQVSDKEIERIFSDEIYEQYYKNENAYKTYGTNQISYEENVELQQLVEATKQQIKNEYNNLGNSMGFAIKNPQTGKIQYSPLLDYYRSTLDGAVIDIASGAFSYNAVLKRTINQMTNSGVRYIDYDSGVHNRVDVAARRAVMTGFRQVQGKINEQVAKDLNTDKYEVSWHVGARPTHQPWQGRVYSYQGLVDVCGLGSVGGLHGANCYHDYNAFIPGVSARTYTDEWLDEQNEKENTPRRYGEKEYTTYEALQHQRSMERNMRKSRQDIKLLQEGGAEEQDIILKKARYQSQMQAYVDFSKKMELPQQMDRVYQDGLTGKFTPTKKEQNQLKKKQLHDTIGKTVAKTSGNAIIKLSQEEQKVLQSYKSFESYIINEALRNTKDVSKLPLSQQKFVENLDSALLKMPKYKGDLIRAVDFSSWRNSDERTRAYVEEFTPGKQLKIGQYWSTSKKDKYNDNASVKIYIQNAEKGRDISSIGLNEDEVLYERNSKFTVVAKVLNKGTWHILLKEG